MNDEIFQCKLKDFLDHYTPWQVPQTTVDDVYKFYVEGGQRNSVPLVKKIDSEQGWHAPAASTVSDDSNFVNEPTTTAESSESTTLKKVREIVDFLQEREVKDKLVEIGRIPTLCYKDYPYENATSEDATSESEDEETDVCFDAYLTEQLNNRQVEYKNYRDASLDGVDPADVVVAAQFKEHLKDKFQNRRQLIKGVPQILNNDPCRTWIYAFTIEDTRMSMWYFSRSHIAVSVSFDFTKDIKSFIHIFLSLIYATREEIGYDPTVHRVVVDEEIHYVYEVESEGRKRYFRTMGTLFTSRGLHIIGKGTRAWKAVEVEGYEDGKCNTLMEGGREVALKDCWLDEEAKTEKVILGDIFNRLENVKHDPTILDWANPPIQQLFRKLLDSGDYKQYFMGIETDMQLSTTKPRLSSAKPVPDFLVEPIQHVRSSSRHRAWHSWSSLAEMVAEGHKADQRRFKSFFACEYKTKRHCRLIYEEVGQPLYRATNLRSTFYAVADTLIALTLLYLAGYVHRDVSTGNIIMIEKPNGETRAKLNDLEYAKVFLDGEHNDRRTGTLFFMPYEIHTRHTLYILPPDFDPSWGSRQSSPAARRSPSRIPPHWLRDPKYRFTHDLESLLWVLLYFFTKYLLQDKQSRIFEDIYYNSIIPSHLRGDLIEMSSGAFRGYFEARLEPEVAAGFAVHLARCQWVLRWSYLLEENVERMLEWETYGKVYGEFYRAFEDMRSLVLEMGDVVPDFGGL